MAEYLKIVNDNNTVIIDDAYLVPSILYRVSVLSDSTVLYPPNYNERRPLSVKWVYQGGLVVKSGTSLRDLGFDYDSTTDNLNLINSNLIAFGRSASTDPFSVSGQVIYVPSTALYHLSASCSTNTLNQTVEVVCFAMNLKLMPSSTGLHLFDANGSLLFDAMRGSMHNIGVLEGSISLGPSIAKTYNIATPTGLSASNIFISCRSRAPYYAGFTFSGSGIRLDDAFYAPRMTLASNSLKVDLVKIGKTGRSYAYSFGGFFENVIYVQQKPGVYL